MRRNTLEEAEVFKELGCEVEEVDVVWNYGVFDAWQTHWRVCLLELPVTFCRVAVRDGALCRAFARTGLSHSAARLYQCYLVAGDMCKTLAPILDRYNILICPTKRSLA